MLGRRLADDEEAVEQVGPLTGVPVLGLDALASAAYGPEAALTVLLPLGALAATYVLPVMLCVLGLLLIVFVSYRQTIEAYPGGGGSYTVAKENLGTTAGLVAAAALSLDYVLNVAVATSAGVGALVSAVPTLLPYMVPLALGILAVLTVLNVRGMRSTGLALMIPAYGFLACFLVILALGIGNTLLHGGHPTPVVASPTAHLAPTGAVSAWLLCHAFASGCSAMTGVEAVSNGVPAFRKPSAVNARRALTLIVAALGVLLAGVAILARAYGLTATEPGEAGYQSLLSQVVGAVVGRGAFYYVTLSMTVALLALSANTSFADFPRLCRILAADGFLPEAFVHRGRRLAFSVGIGVLTGLAALLLVVFGGITDALIPLFAVGAFLAFTMSQAGMVAHWRRVGGPGARRRLIINACGAAATAVALIIILAAKFTEGAWITVLLIAVAFFTFRGVRRHYQFLEAQTRTRAPLDLTPPPDPIVVVPVRRWDRVAQNGLRFALKLSQEIYAVQVVGEEDPRSEDLSDHWKDLVEEPAKQQGVQPPRLVVLRSRYRRLFRPLVRFVTTVARAHPGRPVAVVIPQLVERRWYHYLLHDQTASILKALLLLRGRKGIIIINTPWYVGEPAGEATA